VTAAQPGRLLLFITPAHECSYLPGREATTVFVDPSHPKSPALYGYLSRSGFRRSGEHIYRPECGGCQACVPIRVPVASFRPRRSQRRIRRANADLSVRTLEAAFHPEHFALYQAYVNGRHRGGGMDDPTERQYLEFLTSPWSETLFFEFRAGSALVAVAVADLLTDGLSAVYTFFDPALSRRGLGVEAVLWQIEETQRRGLEWLYLGYWVEHSPKMEYKLDYQPQEHFLGGHWAPVAHRR
jgi:arginine-tRNA-protein transferase